MSPITPRINLPTTCAPHFLCFLCQLRTTNELGRTANCELRTANWDWKFQLVIAATIPPYFLYGFNIWTLVANYPYFLEANRFFWAWYPRSVLLRISVKLTIISGLILSNFIQSCLIYPGYKLLDYFSIK